MSEISRTVRTVYIEPIAANDVKGLSRAAGFLTAEELQRAAKYRIEASRRTFITCRALLRMQLSQMTDVAPRHWHFTVNSYGRPEIIEPTPFRHIRFNVSHTDGLIMCAFSDTLDVGVDAERIQQPHLDIVDRFFARSERVAFRRTAEAQLARTFFKYWTLKEAYVKARGYGLSIALDSFAIDICENGEIRLEIDEHLDPRRHRWIFRSMQPTETHVTALCIDGSGDGEVNIFEEWAELGDTQA
ncbi:4'-phosphopantetheinyl transferase superfamily protein [Mesorhizobium sp. M0772]|uniref:4'-phosphopantetheinyl transferase family protein n=1 Tax=Mesorhizobium sp. M0772 TaxID=2956998 RepID=UPI003336507F